MGVLDFDIGIALLSEYDADGFPTIQIDAYGEKLSGVEPYEHHSPHGILSRPHDPDTDDEGNPALGCQVLYANEGGRGHAWISYDPRIVPLLPKVKKGGFAFYGGKLKNPSFGYIDGENNAFTLYVPYRIDENDVAQRAMTLEVNTETEGKESFSIIHGSGASITMVEDDGEVSTTIKNPKGDVYVEVSDEAVTINGQLIINGAVSAGGDAGTALVVAEPLITILNEILTLIASINISFTQGAAVPAIQAQVNTIAAKFTKGA